MTEGSEGVALSDLLAHREWVRALARRLAADESRADDIEQETWLAAMRRPPRHAGSLRGWLAAVARNVARKLHRSETRRTVHEGRRPAPGLCAPASELAARADAHRRLVQAVVELPEPIRQTVLLRYFEGLGLREVAEGTAAPYETARKRLRAGIGMLRKRLDREQRARGTSLTVLLAIVLDAPRGGLEGTAATTAVGGILMTAKAKLALVAGALILVTGGWYVAGTSSNPPADPPKQAIAELGRDRPEPPGESPRAGAQDEGPQPGTSPAERPSGPPIEEKVKRLVSNLNFEKEDVDRALAEVAGKAGFEIALTRRAVSEIEEQKKRASLVFREDVPARTALDLITDLNGLAWEIRDGRVVVRVRGEARDMRDGLVFPPRYEPDPDAPRSVKVVGRVLDAQGAALGAAEIWLVAHDRGWKRAGSAEIDGAYSVEVRRPFPLLAARAPGRRGSTAHPIRGDYGDTIEIDLVLRGPAGEVSGVVLDPEGRAAADARVEVGFTGASPEQSNAPIEPPPFVTRTDADGRFRDRSVAAGERRIKASRKGSVPGPVTVAVAAGGSHAVEVRLGRGASVSGVVRDGAGRPVSGAMVHVTWPRGRIVTPAETAADGSYRFTGLLPVPIEITVRGPAGRAASASFSPRPDEDLRWDPVLPSGFGIDGRIVDGAGKPIAGFQLRSLGDQFEDAFGRRHDAQTRVSAESGPDGRFSIPELDPSPYRIAVIPPTQTVPVAIVEDVRPGLGEPLLIRVTEDDLPVAVLRGRLLDAAGRPLTRARIRILHVASGASVYARLQDDGTFESPRLPAAEYRVRIRAAGLGSIHSGPHTIRAAGPVDLGDVRFEEPGKVEVTAHRPTEVSPFTWLFVGRADADARLASEVGMTLGAGKASTVVLAPGRYALRFQGFGTASETRQVEVAAGATSKVDVHLKAAPDRVVALAIPEAVVSRAVRLELVTPAGEVLHRAVLQREDPAGPVRAVLPLLPGTHRLRAGVTGGRRLSGTVTIPDRAAPGEVFPVTLR